MPNPLGWSRNRLLAGPGSSPRLASQVANREREEILDECIAKLEAKHRDVILHRDYAGGSWEWVAEERGNTSSEAARKLYARARIELAKKALGMSREAVIEEVLNANLRGLGGAGFPAGRKWSFVPKDSSGPNPNTGILHRQNERVLLLGLKPMPLLFIFSVRRKNSL